jgi:hypothetical protein
MRTERRTQDSWERRRWYFTWELPSGATITESSWLASSPDVVIGAEAPYLPNFEATGLVYCWTLEGAPEGNHEIINRVLLSDGQRLEESFILIVTP